MQWTETYDTNYTYDNNDDSDDGGVVMILRKQHLYSLFWSVGRRMHILPSVSLI